MEEDRPAEVAAAVEVAEEDGAGAMRAHPTRLLVRDNTCVQVLVSSSAWSKLTSFLSLLVVVRVHSCLFVWPVCVGRGAFFVGA